IDRMMRDAEAHAEEDHQRREAAETRNQAEQLVYTTEKFIKDNGDRVPAEVKTEVETSLTELKDALKGEDLSAIRDAAEKVGTISQKLGSAMYANPQPGAEGAAGAGAAGDTADDDVVDAEIVDDDKRGGGTA
ncbi:Hsp70 family protein, partial [Embleya sp. NPDC050493]|uniref:Hsp70 family protein n=1 Tax=Embleya sp. NPDC050493 TaxID=3363989 RepID=UPI00378F0E73